MSSSATTATGYTVNTLRSLILHGLLLILLILLGTGLSLLLSILLRGFTVTDDRQLVLAMALALTVIPGPLAWALWVWIRKKLINTSPTDAAVWSVQGAVLYLIALIMASTALLQLLSTVVLGTASDTWQDHAGTAVGWGLIAGWQFTMLKSTKYAPQELPHLAATLGNAYAVGLTGFSLIVALRTALELMFVPADTLVGPSQLPILLEAVIWLLGAAVLWFWHWKLQGVQQLRDLFSSIVVMLVGVCLAALATLLAATATLNILIPLPWDFTAMADRFASFGPFAVATLLTGALMWIYHDWQLKDRGDQLKSVARQMISGISLALLASGLGMVINALLAALSTQMSTGTAESVLRTGIALTLVGGLTWVRYFRPGAPAAPGSRRVYLVLFFGVSAVVALVSLLIVGYRVFEILVGATTSTVGLLDYIRGPLGWLVATAGVCAYHFVLWKSDRDQLAAERAKVSQLPHAEVTAPRTVIVVVPQGSDRLLSALSSNSELDVRWIASSGPQLPETVLDQLASHITATVATSATSLLAVADTEGQVSFTALSN